MYYYLRIYFQFFGHFGLLLFCRQATAQEAYQVVLIDVGRPNNTRFCVLFWKICLVIRFFIYHIVTVS